MWKVSIAHPHLHFLETHAKQQLYLVAPWLLWISGGQMCLGNNTRLDSAFILLTPLYTVMQEGADALTTVLADPSFAPGPGRKTTIVTSDSAAAPGPGAHRKLSSLWLVNCYRHVQCRHLKARRLHTVLHTGELRHTVGL